MPIASDNPFASPQSDDEGAPPAPDRQADAPGSVRLAIGGLVAIALMMGLTVLWVLVAEREVAWILVPVVVANLLVVRALVKRDWLGWWMGRSIALLFGLASALLVALVVAFSWAELSVLLSGQAGALNAGTRSSLRGLLGFTAGTLLVTVLYVVVHAALGRRDARSCLGWFCSCGSHRLTWALRERRLMRRCKRCGSEW